MSATPEASVKVQGTVDDEGAVSEAIAGRELSAYASLSDFLDTHLLDNKGGAVVVHPEALLDDETIAVLQSAEAIAIAFPTFADGRGYSHARRIRDAGYAGTIVAYGDIGLDQLHYLKRSGCDRFALREGTDLGKAKATFARFGHQYVGIRSEVQS